MLKFLSLLVCFSFTTICFAQKIDNFSSFRAMDSNSYIRFHYDNDYFTAQDENYTQGYAFEVVFPKLKKNPLNHLFFEFEESQNQYGISLEHIGFTPENYGSPEIQFGDRPFAAAIYLKSFLTAKDYKNHLRVSSSFSVGIIGPGAFGEELQTSIHKATGNTIPLGWKNQIQNDVVLNYELNIEKHLWHFRKLFYFSGIGSVQLGSLFTQANFGVNTMVGLLNTPLFENESKQNFQLYFYAQPQLNAIGYDATLQGGLFTNDSPYIISSANVERLTSEISYGIVLKTNTIYIEYTRTHISKEFQSGDQAKWGGIRIGFSF